MSNYGRKRSASGVVFVPDPRQDGYVQCQFKGIKETLMHRFVCTLFHGSCPGEGFTVHHKDGNRSNNHATNLEWVDWETQHHYKSYRANAWVRNRSDNVDMEGEVWIEVDPNNGKAAVSNFGRWKDNRYGRRSSPIAATDGYVNVTLYYENKKLHDMVCTAFHGPKPTDQHTANHKDNNKSNNNKDNLEWMSRSEQVTYCYSMGKKRTKAKSQGKPTLARRVGDINWVEYKTVNMAAQAFGVSPGNAAACARGKYNATKGVEFKYLAPSDTLNGEVWKDVIISDWVR